MVKEFVVTWNELHRQIGALTRQSRLVPVFDDSTTQRKSPEARAVDIVHDVEGLERFVPQRYYELLGIPLLWGDGSKARTSHTLYDLANYFDAERVDPYCSWGQRNRISSRVLSLFAVDVLAFGVGILRPVRASSTGFHAVVGEPIGRLTPRNTRVYGHALARTHMDPEDNNTYHSEEWESTNVLYGDMYGEVQQCNERRKNRKFLEEVCQAFQHLPHHLENRIEELQPVYEAHLACQALWDLPPTSPDELLQRVDYILSHSTLDQKPAIKVKNHKVYKGGLIVDAEF